MTNKLALLASLFLVLNTGHLYSQKADSSKRLIFSFGIRANTFLLSDFAMKNLPPARLQLNFDLTKFLRLEVQYGFNKTIQDHQIQTSSSTFVNYPTISSTSIYSGGLFFMKKLEKVNFYGGVRYGRASYTNEQLSGGFSSVPTVVSYNGKIGMFSGVLGGEYFMARRFSIAGEFAFVHMKDTYSTSDPLMPGYPDVITINNLSETSLVLRFYPF